MGSGVDRYCLSSGSIRQEKHDYLSLYLCASTVSIIAVTVL